MDDKVFELLTKLYAEMNGKFDKINAKFDEMNVKFDEISDKLDRKADKSDIVRLENEINPKISALFDGYKQHTDILESIEKQISRQDEIIMRRIK